MKEKRRHESDSSESEQEWIEKHVPSAKNHSGNDHTRAETKRKRHDSLHSNEDENRWIEKRTATSRKKDGRHGDDRTQDHHSSKKKRSPVAETHKRHTEKGRRYKYSEDSSDEEMRRGTKRKERSHEKDDRSHRRHKRQRHDTYTDSD